MTPGERDSKPDGSNDEIVAAPLLTCGAPDRRSSTGTAATARSLTGWKYDGVIDVLVVTAEDWRLWRELRRAALLEAPGAFGSTLAEWSGEADTEARWRARLGDVALNLVLVFDGGPVGMVSALAPGADGTVELISLWIAPAARGRGVGDEAIRQVVAWALDKHPRGPVMLSVKSENNAARLLYERHGFVDAGTSPDDPTERLMRR